MSLYDPCFYSNWCWVQTKYRSEQENSWLHFCFEKNTACKINLSYPVLKYRKSFFIKHHIKWRGGGGQFCRELYDHEETTTYKTQSQIRNCMFLAPHLSTGASLNRIFGVKVIPEQSNKTWLFFQKKVVRTRLV